MSLGSFVLDGFWGLSKSENGVVSLNPPLNGGDFDGRIMRPVSLFFLSLSQGLGSPES